MRGTTSRSSPPEASIDLQLDDATLPDACDVPFDPCDALFFFRPPGARPNWLVAVREQCGVGGIPCVRDFGTGIWRTG